MPFQFSDGQSSIKGDFSKLENLISELKSEHFTEIGVFATAKTTDGQNVAEYGAYNEFGSVTVKDRPPKRSFIRMPLETKAEVIVEYVKNRAKKHLEKGDVKAIFEDIAIGAESVIQGAFDTRGYGTWPDNAESTIKAKNSSTPLINDGTLRKSITHRTE